MVKRAIEEAKGYKKTKADQNYLKSIDAKLKGLEIKSNFVKRKK